MFSRECKAKEKNDEKTHGAEKATNQKKKFLRNYLMQ